MPRAVKRAPQKRSYDSSKRQAQARETRRAIRDAAQRLLLDRGYGATTMQAIADEAGVAVQTVYAVFKTKAAIIKEAAEVALVGDDEPIPLLERQMITSIADEPDQRRRLRLAVQAGTTVQRRAARMTVAVRDAGAVDSDLAAWWETGKQQRHMGFTHAARVVAGREGLRIPIEEAADVLWVLCSPDVFVQFTSDKGWPVERYEDWLYDTLERTLLP
jgi:AcrR family transcriptional regulator